MTTAIIWRCHRQSQTTSDSSSSPRSPSRDKDDDDLTAETCATQLKHCHAVEPGVRQEGADRVAAAEKHDVARSIPHQDGREPAHRGGG